MTDDTNDNYIDCCISEAVFALNYHCNYYPEDEEDENSISTAILIILDSFHTEVTEDENNYAMWYLQQQQPNDNDTNIEILCNLCNMKQITTSEFIKFYLLIIQKSVYRNDILLKCLEIDSDENPHLYPQEFLKVLEDRYLFRYLKEFIN